LYKKSEKKIEALDMWIHRKMGKIVWPENKTINEVLKQLKLKSELLNTGRKKEIKFLAI
jgi:hypothetical protein